jgi:capsular polysaccharide biosynthesis protein
MGVTFAQAERFLDDHDRRIPVARMHDRSHAPDPRIITGPIRDSDVPAYAGRAFDLPPADILKLLDVTVFDYGLVWRQGAVLADRRYTVAADEFDGNSEFFSRVRAMRAGAAFTDVYTERAPLQRAVLLGRRADLVHGHWILEVLPKLGLMAMAGFDLRQEGLRFIVPANLKAYQVDMLEAFGVKERFLHFHTDGDRLRVDELFVPGVAHANRGYVDPFSLRTYDHLVRQGRSEGLEGADIFVTRRMPPSHSRELLNLTAIETLMHKRGFVVYDPAERPWQNQVATFASARRIYGVGGSGMHNTVFAGPSIQTLVLQSSHVFNFLQSSIAGIRGHDVSYCIGEAFAFEGRPSWIGKFFVDPDDLMEAVEYLDRPALNNPAYTLSRTGGDHR